MALLRQRYRPRTREDDFSRRNLSELTAAKEAAFALVIGVFFGSYPAREAARLDSVEASRFE
jgi:hypothetical protein